MPTRSGSRSGWPSQRRSRNRVPPAVSGSTGRVRSRAPRARRRARPVAASPAHARWPVLRTEEGYRTSHSRGHPSPAGATPANRRRRRCSRTGPVRGRQSLPRFRDARPSTEPSCNLPPARGFAIRRARHQSRRANCAARRLRPRASHRPAAWRAQRPSLAPTVVGQRVEHAAGVAGEAGRHDHILPRCARIS